MRKTVMPIIAATAIGLGACQWGQTPADDAIADTITTADGNYTDNGQPLPLFLWYHNRESMNVVLWTATDRPEGRHGSGSRRALADWQRQESVRSHAREYNNIFFGAKHKERIHFVAETLVSPDGNDLDGGVLHNRYFPSASISYALDQPDRVRVQDFDEGTMEVIATDSYLADHTPTAFSHNIWRDSNDDRPLAANIIARLEQQYGHKALRSHLAGNAGKHCSYGIVQFEVAADHALALEVVAVGDSIYSLPVRGTNDPDTISFWHANDSGIYAPSRIHMLFDGPQGPELCYEQRRPDAVCVGVMYVRDGQLQQRQQAQYAIIADEGNRRPLWHSDFALLQELYDAAAADTTGSRLTKWCWVDIDGDGRDELWLRADDDRHGAFYTYGDRPELICCESPTLRPRLYMGRIRISRTEGGSKLYYANYIISGSRLRHTFLKTEVYGALSEASLDRRPLSQEECLDFQESLPKAEHPAQHPEWHAIE